MSIEFQIRSSTLAAIVTRSMQQRLRETCFPSVGGIFIDHADVAPVAPGFSAESGVVRVRVPVDVFVVGRDEVLAAPNAVPVGATRPALRAEIVLVMRAIGAEVSLSVVDLDPNPFGDDILADISVPLSFNLDAMMKKLGSPPLVSSSVELADETVCVRFNATDAATEHLFADHEWGLFLDGAAVERLALEKVPKNLSSVITSMRLTPHWRPIGQTPHVDIDYEGAAQVPDPLSGRINGSFSCDIAVIPTPAQMRRVTASWTLSIDLGGVVPASVDDLVARTIADAMDPRKFGGTPTGPRSFFVEDRLPDVPFAGGRLDYSSAMASPAGMTIGGTVRLAPEPGRDVLRAGVSKFSNPHIEVLASHHGCVPGWSGEVGPIRNMKVAASVQLGMLGEFCTYEVISPGDWIKNYTSLNPWDNESLSLIIKLPVLTAVRITEPVQILVTTSRGVRLIDFGKPDIEVDEEGNIVNLDIVPIDDCLHMMIYEWYWATLPVDPITGKPLPPPPKPWPPPEWDIVNVDWLTSPPDVDAWNNYIESLNALNIQLVTLTRLQPGELIQLRSFEHAVDVTADSNGRAMVPVLLSFRDRLEPAKLTRVNRQRFNGTVTVRTAVFEWHANLQAGNRRNRVATATNNATYVIAESMDGAFAYQLGTLGVSRRLDIAEVPQIELEDQANFEKSLELPGLVSLIRLPGFPDEPIALAVMSDDSVLVLDLTEEGQVRVAGTFMGPIGAIAENGEWGVVTAPNRITALTVKRSGGVQ